VNGQIEMILDKALKDAGRKKEKLSNNNTTAKSLVKNKI
jgi:hypothetical protein